MKIKLLSLGLLLMSISSWAQKAQVETGLKLGLNMSNVMGAQPQQFKPGAHFSGFVEMPFSYFKKFSMTAELMYSMQGYTGKEYQQYNITTFAPTEMLKLGNVTTHNIYIPITFNYYINEKVGVHLGGQVGYMVDASGEFDINKANPARQFMNDAKNTIDKYLFEQGYRSTDHKDYYEKIDYGVVAGLTYDINENFFVSARYYLGLQDFYKRDNNYEKISLPDNSTGAISQNVYNQMVEQANFFNKYIKTDPITNSVVQLSVGYKF